MRERLADFAWNFVGLLGVFISPFLIVAGIIYFACWLWSDKANA